VHQNQAKVHQICAKVQEPRQSFISTSPKHLALAADLLTQRSRKSAVLSKATFADPMGTDKKAMVTSNPVLRDRGLVQSHFSANPTINIFGRFCPKVVN